MLSIHYNSHTKSWRNRKSSWKVIKVKPFIDKYDWEWIKYSSEKKLKEIWAK